MPIYEYQCSNCGNVKEILHSVSELENPSNVIIEEKKCCNKQMQRIFSVPGVKTPTSAEYLHRDRKKRNHNHFKKEVLPTMDIESRNHHLKKLNKKP